MSDILAKIDQATTQLQALQQERADCEKEANALEEQARAKRRRMVEVKAEIATLNNVLGHAQVASQAQQAAQAAAKAQADAQATLERLAAKEKEQDAKAKEAADKQAAESAAFADKAKALDAKMAELDALLAKAKSPPAS